jgi:hypothetical protein
MKLTPGWTHRATNSDFVKILDHQAGYIVLGVLDGDELWRWDIAKGRGRQSRIVSGRPLQTMAEAVAEAERLIAEDYASLTALPVPALQAG